MSAKQTMCLGRMAFWKFIKCIFEVKSTFHYVSSVGTVLDEQGHASLVHPGSNVVPPIGIRSCSNSFILGLCFRTLPVREIDKNTLYFRVSLQYHICRFTFCILYLGIGNKSHIFQEKQKYLKKKSIVNEYLFILQFCYLHHILISMMD